MLTPRVDLTAHMDFSGGSIIDFFDTRLDEILDDEYALISTDEYKRLTWWEDIFGRKKHKNQKHEIFSKDINELMTRCLRCGKPFRIPWDNIGSVCRKCNYEIFDPSHNLPWKRNNNPSVNERSIIYNLFNSR